jgi:hypothetical protein
VSCPYLNAICAPNNCSWVLQLRYTQAQELEVTASCAKEYVAVKGTRMRLNMRIVMISESKAMKQTER